MISDNQFDHERVTRHITTRESGRNVVQCSALQLIYFYTLLSGWCGYNTNDLMLCGVVLCGVMCLHNTELYPLYPLLYNI